MNEQFATIDDGITLCYETFGERSDPAILLVMGLSTQMIAWHEEFCEQLAGRGFFVIRYDNRDIGRSTRLDRFPPPTPVELLTRRIKNPPYTLSDMARDGVQLLDALGIDKAHIVGASMGGMIAQMIAAEHPERVLSLVSIMSMTGNRWKGQPALKVYPMLLAKPPKTKDEAVSRLLKLFRVVGSPGFDRDEDDLARQGALAWERGPAGAGGGRQLGAIVASGDRTKAVSRVRVPTLVIHGTSDKLVNVSGGRATAKAIPGSELMLIDGMGHDLPRGVWDRVIDGVVRNAGRAGAGAQVAA